MRTTMDGAGRIVVPKAIRDALRVAAGQPLEIELRDGRIEIEVAATPMSLQGEGGLMVAVPDQPLPALTVDQVRETLDQVRR